jgi:hypothetical protein
MLKSEYIKARKLLSNPQKWNQGKHAIDCFGMQCLPTNPNAIRWCALAACNKYAKETDFSRKELILAARQLGFLSITHLNDSGTHEDVLKMFDLAIQYCDEKFVLC